MYVKMQQLMIDNMKFTELFQTKLGKSYAPFSEATCFANECSERHESEKHDLKKHAIVRLVTSHDRNLSQAAWFCRKDSNNVARHYETSFKSTFCFAMKVFDIAP